MASIFHTEYVPDGEGGYIADCGCIRCTEHRVYLQGEQTPMMFGIPVELHQMFLCGVCGNKRCPKSDDHRNACTGSNEPGQKGSRYE